MSIGPPGEVDLHLFNEGRHRRLWEVLGAHLPADDGAGGAGASFAVWAPNARRVSVRGDWDGWTGAVELSPQRSSGIWWGTVAGASEGHAYKFEVHTATGVTLRSDPMARRAETPPLTASVLDRSQHVWARSRAGFDAARLARSAGRISIYEVHLGSWRHHPGRGPWTALELAAELPAWVAEHGFTHVELMPPATHPFGGSWGYQVTGYYAPDARLGAPDDLRHLIEAFHEQGVGVIVDWVPAHFPRDEYALARFDGTALYEHADPRRGSHPDWGTLVFNHDRHEVRCFLLANALYWLEEFRADGLRVDAVASMLYRDYSRAAGEWVPNVHGGREDLGAVSFLQELNAVVAEEHPGALVVAEESTSWPGVTAAVRDGGLGFTHKWNLGWMHDTLDYLRREPVHRAHHHHEMTFPMVYAPHERWVLPLSHDEVVHGKGSLLSKMPGDEWQRFANLRALLAWQWCHPGRPLLFMGGELAQLREWSHERELDWWLLSDRRHEGIRRLVTELNRLQAELPALWAGDDLPPDTFGWLDADDAAHSVFAFWRRAPGGGTGSAGDQGVRTPVVVVANLTPVPRPGYRLGAPEGGAWRLALDTDDPRWGGSGHLGAERGPVEVEAEAVPWQGQEASLGVALAPLAVMVWVPEWALSA
jgi:1,4-alpha-glucan branching enzyme